MYGGIALASIIVTVLILAAMQPNELRVTRTGTIAASPAAVHLHLNNFHNWEAWSPWAKLDPDAKNTFSGAEAGPGAMFAWSGNNKVGEGKMTILESRPGELVKIKLEFLRPMRGISTAEFTLQGQGSQTTVTWTMYGDNQFMGKIFCLFMNMGQDGRWRF